jgi:hypothetical protein
MVVSRGIFVTERAETPVQKHASQNIVLKPFFLGFGFMKLGMSCYPATRLSSKVAYFVQFLYVPPLWPNFGSLYMFHNLFL